MKGELSKRALSGIILILLLIGMLALTFNTRSVRTSATTIIVPDDYPTIQDAVNSAHEGDTVYVKAGTYETPDDGINIRKNGLKIIGEDARKTTIDSNAWGALITVEKADNVIVSGFSIDGFVMHGDTIDDTTGILVWGCSNFSFYGNIFKNFGTLDSMYMWISDSNNCSIYGNKEDLNWGADGIFVSSSSNCSFYGNGLRTWRYGYSIILYESDNNLFFHNELWWVSVSDSFSNEWDNGYPSGGNYWVEYDSLDEYSGPYQNETGSDGIGDVQYIIDEENIDRYPLMNLPTGPVHNVNSGLDFWSIQEAIDAPETSSGNRIEVDAGIYYENVVLNKSLILVGEDSKTTVIDGNYSGPVVTISTDNVRIKEITIRNGGLDLSGIGLLINHSSDNDISDNLITDNNCGIWLNYSSDNIVSSNKITLNKYGIWTLNSSNWIFHNDFINNTVQVYNNHSQTTWDNGYPSGGNYWSDYTGIDLYGGLYQNETGNDGIGDVAYIVDDMNQDNYPFINPWGPVHNLNTSLNYASPQEAISADETMDGHTILVDEQEEPYENVILSKPLRLIGINREGTIIHGIYANTSNISVINFTIENANTGIYLEQCGDSIVQRNIVTANDRGILIDNCYGCKIIENTVKNNLDGILLSNSSNSILKNNIMTENSYNFGVMSEDLSGYLNNIDASNTINGKPIRYLTNQHNQTVDQSMFSNLGYLALINSTNLAVRNLTIVDNREGILLAYTTDSTIENVTVKSNKYGIRLDHCYSSIITKIRSGSNDVGILVSYSNESKIDGNELQLSVPYFYWPGPIVGKFTDGLSFISSNNSVIRGNTFLVVEGGARGRALLMHTSFNNTIYHNNVYYCEIISTESTFSLDNGYPSGGNYWSDYTGDDLDCDGIGDSWYEIGSNNTDHYPLMGMFHSFKTSLGEYVNVISNSTIEDFEYFENNSTIRMHVSNMASNQIFGFCRVCISHALIDPDKISVIIDNGQTFVLYHNYTLYDNSTHRWIYFAYEHSTHEVVIQEDTTPPTISVLSPENKTYTINNVPLTFTLSEPTYWIGYSLNGQTNVTITENTTLHSLVDRSYYVVVYANDTVGNMGVSHTVYFTVDTTPPNIADVSQIPLPDNVLPEDEVKVNATVTDNVSEVKQVTLVYAYANSSGTWIRVIDMTNLEGNIWNAPIPAFPYCTNVTYTIIAEDNAGNTITTEEMEYDTQYHVIPEFPSFLILPLFMIATLLAVIIYKRKHTV